MEPDVQEFLGKRDIREEPDALVQEMNNFLEEDIHTGIRDERDRQIAKWGEQAHPDGTGGEYYASMQYLAKETVDRGSPTWADILQEEVWEALSEIEPGKLRVELIQVAAVCVAWIKDLNTRNIDKQEQEEV